METDDSYYTAGINADDGANDSIESWKHPECRFDQIFNLYNPIVYETADIIDTYVYRIGMVERQYSIGAAVGLLKSVISFILILSANKCAKKATGSGIF